LCAVHQLVYLLTNLIISIPLQRQQRETIQNAHNQWTSAASDDNNTDQYTSVTFQHLRADVSK